MLKIKLSPTGKKHDIHYRIIVAEEHKKLTSTPTATIGHYHPHTKSLTFNKELALEWMKKGAQPTQKIRRLLKI